MQRIPMTPSGYQKVNAELKHLKEVVRPGIVRDIEEARAHGDISENSEFEDAKERQALTEGRIRELGSRLALSEVIDITKVEASDRVIFGSTVLLEDLSTEEEIQFKVVGEEEADAKIGLVSYSSPIGRALIGKEVDEEVVVRAPGGVRRFAVIEVQYV